MKRPSLSADSRRAGGDPDLDASAAVRSKPRIKTTKRGRPCVLPDDHDGIFELPDLKRETRPAAPLARKIGRITLASRLPGDKARSYMRAIGLTPFEQSAEALAAIERWLRKPERCDPPRFGRDAMPFDQILRQSYST